MSRYPFDVLRADVPEPLQDPSPLADRPFAAKVRSLQTDAPRFIPGDALAAAINTAICVAEPLLITGEPGTGKTQTAYYAAWKLNLGEVLHFQVKSDSTARDLLYHFDMVRYFQDAHLGKLPISEMDDQSHEALVVKRRYREKRQLWEAFEDAEVRKLPRVLLIDEIDKAPRDFPNDLLHELDQMEFHVAETGEQVQVNPGLRPIVFITSNSERRLPEPFLRRCVYHHIQFEASILQRVLKARRDEFGDLSDGFLELAVERFLALRDRGLQKIPSTGELLVWLRALAAAGNVSEARLRDTDPMKLPYLGVLLKNRQDLLEGD
jgi:MoxR-like ATPase